MAQNTTVIDYTMYEDSTEFIGLAQVTLPDLSFLTQTVSGSGLAGEIEVPIIGQMSAMEMSVQFLVRTDLTDMATTPVTHIWELREAQQVLAADSADTSVTTLKHVIKAVPKSSSGGTLKPASTSDPDVTASVVYWATYRDGEMVMELDPINYICYINGEDYLEPVRSALGK